MMDDFSVRSRPCERMARRYVNITNLSNMCRVFFIKLSHHILNTKSDILMLRLGKYNIKSLIYS